MKKGICFLKKIKDVNALWLYSSIVGVIDTSFHLQFQTQEQPMEQARIRPAASWNWR